MELTRICWALNFFGFLSKITWNYLFFFCVTTIFFRETSSLSFPIFLSVFGIKNCLCLFKNLFTNLLLYINEKFCWEAKEMWNFAEQIDETKENRLRHNILVEPNLYIWVVYPVTQYSLMKSNSFYDLKIYAFLS